MEILDVCKLKIWAFEDEKGLADLGKNSLMQKKKSSKVETTNLQENEILLKVQKSRETTELNLEVWMINQVQATEVVEMYMKVKKSSKI